MQFVTIKGMNNLVAYGAPDGDYYTVDEWKGKSDMHVVAKVRKGKIKVNGFKDMKEAIKWSER